MGTQEQGTSTGKFTAAVSGMLAASKLFAVAAVLVTCGAMGADFLRPKQTFYVESDGRETEVFPLNEPNVTTTSLLKWVTQAVTNAYTMDFYHYQDTLDSLKQYFTFEGYDNYVNSVKASGSLKKIIADKLVVGAVAIDTAVILQEGMMNGVYSWKVQLPLLLTYQGASTTNAKKTIVVNVLINRVPTNLAPKGIGIAQIVDEDYHA